MSLSYLRLLIILPVLKIRIMVNEKDILLAYKAGIMKMTSMLYKMRPLMLMATIYL